MIIKLQPACKDYLWGGDKLKREFGKAFDGDILAETWELSCHPDGESTVIQGPDAGLKLSGWIKQQGWEVLGENCKGMTQFPVLVKLIDARSDLSIQVHPSDEYAWKHENQPGKTEMWYVVDREPGSFLYCGFRETISREEMERRIGDDTLTDVLQQVEVQPGDLLFIPAGTIHAIGAGITIAEIQQSSNVTYRVSDYGRRDKDGNLRPLHVKQALEVTERKPADRSRDFGGHLCACRYFCVDRLEVKGTLTDEVTDDSFAHLLIVEGEGAVRTAEETVAFRKGDSLLLTAGSGDFQIDGAAVALKTTIPEAE